MNVFFLPVLESDEGKNANALFLCQLSSAVTKSTDLSRIKLFLHRELELPTDVCVGMPSVPPWEGAGGTRLAWEAAQESHTWALPANSANLKENRAKGPLTFIFFLKEGKKLPLSVTVRWPGGDITAATIRKRRSHQTAVLSAAGELHGPPKLGANAWIYWKCSK